MESKNVKTVKHNELKMIKGGKMYPGTQDWENNERWEAYIRGL